jgi:hypothetical protein
MFERFSLADRRFGRPDAMRLFSIACALVGGLWVLPQLSQAGIIIPAAPSETNSQLTVDFAGWNSPEFSAVFDVPARPTKPEPAGPTAREPLALAIAEVELDGLREATTSGPITGDSEGGSAAPAMLRKADLRLPLAWKSHNHTFRDLAAELPPPDEMLDPPRPRCEADIRASFSSFCELLIT